MSYLEHIRKIATPPKPETFDSVGAEPSAYAETDTSLAAVSAVQEWCSTDDLDEGESMADRLLALMVGVADEDVDGELGDDETAVFNDALNAAYEYMVAKGVTAEDAEKLLTDFDADTATRVRDALAEMMPDGESAAWDEMNEFSFGSGEAVEPALDAVYRKRLVVRKGRKVRINKRIAGVVRLNAKQKLAIRKARMKSHSSKAKMHRARSVKKRAQFGLNK